jgi:hypothetical protein
MKLDESLENFFSVLHLGETVSSVPPLDWADGVL